ncbi:MAG: tyrosine-type recombinase/integrase [Lachnospiraceae bacterium]|nr:tyrosine-type recombinase/integrase [Lachnospiraceae bacterium]
MTDREKLINQISGILLAHDCLTDEVQSEIFLALDLYEIRKRSTEIVPADPMDNEAMIRDFAAAKAVAGRSPKSVRQYVLALRRFTRTMPIRLVDTTAADIRKYTAIRLTRDGLQGRGLVNERDYLSTFFEWAVKAEIMARNPVKQVEGIKLAKIPKKAYTDLECEKIRKACGTPRETAMVEVLFSTACRVSEMCGILTSSIDDRRILICGKGKKYGTIYLDSRAQLAVDTYIESRDDDNPYLFPGRKEDQPVTTRAVERILKEIGKRAGVSNVHAHRFRRTAATMALRRGMPLEMVSKMLRHENLQTTMRYLDLTEEELFYQHQKYVV